jgi:hypothetical protein
MPQRATDYVALALASSVWFGIVAPLQLVVAALAVDVALPAAERSEAVGACVHIQFNVVP